MEELIALNGDWHIKPITVPLKIIFHNHGTLNPKADITPLESVRISMMLTLATTYIGLGRYDFSGYIKEHNLERHFDK